MKKATERFYEVFEDINTRAAIAFGLAMISLLLAYIALVK